MVYEGEAVIAGIGRFGPYLKRGDKYFNVEKGTDLIAMTEEECKAILDDAMKGSSNEVKTFGNQGQFRLVTTYMIDAQGQEGRDSVRTAVLTALKGFKLAEREGSLLSRK